VSLIGGGATKISSEKKLAFAREKKPREKPREKNA
jgi:hypothetical protein